MKVVLPFVVWEAPENLVEALVLVWSSDGHSEAVTGTQKLGLSEARPSSARCHYPARGWQGQTSSQGTSWDESGSALSAVPSTLIAGHGACLSM